MTTMCRQIDGIAWPKNMLLLSPFNFQSRPATQNNDELGLILIVPESARRRLAEGNDALHPYTAADDKVLDKLFIDSARQRRNEIENRHQRSLGA